MTPDNDRRLTVAAIAALGVFALLAAMAIGTLIVLRLHKGEDIQPGEAAFLLALLGIASSAGTLLAPSPLSKSSTADPQPVTGLDGGPVETTDVPAGKAGKTS